MRQNIEFELIGHDSPTGKYPAPVVPIGYCVDTGKLVAVYIDSIESEPILESVAENANFVHHNVTLTELLKDFDYRKDSLFALAPEDVKFYAVQDKEKFFKSLLVDEDFASTNPFLRLSLAEATKDLLLVRKELDPCEKFLEENAPDLAPTWKLEKKISLLELGLLSFTQVDARNFLIEREQLQVLHQIVTGELLAAFRDVEKQQIKPIVEQSKLIQREHEVVALEKQLEETRKSCDQLQRESLLIKESTKKISACLHSLLAMELSDFIAPLNDSLELMKGKMQLLSPNDLFFISRTDPIEYKRLRLDLSNLFDHKSLVDGWLQITQEVLNITSTNQWMVSAQTQQGVKCLQHEMLQIKKQIQSLKSRIDDIDQLFYLSPKQALKTLPPQEPQSFDEQIKTPLPDSGELKRERVYA